MRQFTTNIVKAAPVSAPIIEFTPETTGFDQESDATQPQRAVFGTTISQERPKSTSFKFIPTPKVPKPVTISGQNFTDFMQGDLIGKKVVFTTSDMVVNGKTKMITTIVSVTRSTFKIENYNGDFFYRTGFEQGSGTGYCELITDADAVALQEQLDKIDLIDIIANKASLEGLNLAQLRAIAAAL